jgi:hypothetical protein
MEKNRMTEINESRRKRTGPVPLIDPRTHCVSTRLNDAELRQLDNQRGDMARGEYLRCAALDQLPPSIPAINQAAWISLSRANSNLNQLAKQFNIDTNDKNWEAVVSTLKTFRASLIGAKL